MSHGTWWSVLLGAWLSTQASFAVGAAPVVLTIDPAESRVVIEVGKAGLFGFAGHAHEVLAADVRGRVTVNLADPQASDVSLEFEAAGLRVTGKNEPPGDVSEVQRVMLGERVLDVERFPTIRYRSRRVRVASRTGAAADVVIEGDLMLHGMTRPTTVRTSAAIDAEGRLTARGAFSLKQSDFGMVPVTAAGGTVRVKDELDIQFLLKTRPSSDPQTTR